jgi:hypothetical protein
MGDIMQTMEILRDALSTMSTYPFENRIADSWAEYFSFSTFTCKIGMESNLAPDDYPMIRIVPSTATYGEVLGKMKTEVLIYFGVPIHLFDDRPDTTGRVRLEKIYAALLLLAEAICVQLDQTGGQYIETIFDEDRLDTYKLMAIRARLHG